MSSPFYLFLGQPLGDQGAHSIVREAWLDGKKYIAKAINEDYTDVPRELDISRIASDLGVGPKVHGIIHDGAQGIIIMDQYEMSLEDYLYTHQDDPGRCFDQIIETLRDYVSKLHSRGIIHYDLTADNIFYREPCSIVIGDYGRSFFSTVEHFIQDDWNLLNRIEETIRTLQRGIRFDNRVNFSVQINPKARRL